MLLAGCVGIRHDPVVVINPTADTRVTTTAQYGLFFTRIRIGTVDAGPFVVDSGAFSLAVDVKLAETLGLKLGTEVLYSGEGQPFRYTTVPSVEVGPIVFRNTQAAVMDLSAFTEPLGHRLAGVVGYPFFAAAVVEVDNRRRTVSCFDRATYRLPRGKWLPLILKNRQPGVVARLEGNLEGTFLLDTGSTQTVRFDASFVEKHRLLESRPVRTIRNFSLGAETTLLRGTIAWFELAGRRFENPTVTFTQPRAPPLAAGAFDGLIGYGLLREFVVVFDYAASRVALLRDQ